MKSKHGEEMDCKICNLARLACGHTQSDVIYFGGYRQKPEASQVFSCISKGKLICA